MRMDLTAGTRATAGAGAAVLAGGILVILYGVIRNDLARALGGACLSITALTLIALVVIRKWVTDTSDERRILAAAQREAQGERSRFIALRAGLENEQCRLARDMAAERAALTTRLAAEREAMADEFEERRAAYASETAEVFALMVHGGRFAPATSPTGKVIHFPSQQPEQQVEHVRSREQGVVSP